MYKNLNDVLVKAIEKTGGYVDLAIAQVPDIINQLLLWSMVEAIVYASIGLITVVICSLIQRSLLKACYSSKNPYDGEKYAGGFALCFIPDIIGVMMFIANLLIILKIYVAPKIWLIEYATDLVKGR